VTFDPLELVVHQMSITGSFIGNRAAMKEMLSFAQAQGIAPEVELMPMSRANDAIRRARENQARYRIVLVNDMDRT
jgi:D-arabinose 1-dehydrogenase-like Zn-dependent alcohol dehydrogenase